ncbi:uncharacterized protein A1O9_05955 [Exophiala aquamarina CBS 119918]|uniref:Uncharacterized protein n=1 Tax=Exophiala aquamarina CBS 119918 TaxID=1182545 RepID=A0A072PE25_9EURO|nr:uncharacterized protein A1O9_05955 [Exophiala aquamarina CBS 119918]KEF58032.1 hypothetical protein A1O9_05955 [Exophiala aquamarina CBS 119918]
MMKISSILNDSDDEQYESSSTSCSSESSPSPSSSTLSPTISTLSLSSSPPGTKRTQRKRARQDSRPKKSRGACHKYTREQEHFIWYHRTDLHMPWDQVEHEYKQYFNHDREKGGLQCKYYRVLNSYNVEKVRQQTKWGQVIGKAKIGKYGLLATVKCNYPWIRLQQGA